MGSKRAALSVSQMDARLDDSRDAPSADLKGVLKADGWVAPLAQLDL